jgi:hypothetical protein
MHFFSILTTEVVSEKYFCLFVRLFNFSANIKKFLEN